MVDCGGCSSVVAVVARVGNGRVVEVAIVFG